MFPFLFLGVTNAIKKKLLPITFNFTDYKEVTLGRKLPQPSPGLKLSRRKESNVFIWQTDSKGEGQGFIDVWK